MNLTSKPGKAPDTGAAHLPAWQGGPASSQLSVRRVTETPAPPSDPHRWRACCVPGCSGWLRHGAAQNGPPFRSSQGGAGQPAGKGLDEEWRGLGAGQCGGERETCHPSQPGQTQAPPMASETRLLAWPPAHSGQELLVFQVCSLRPRLNCDQEMISDPRSTSPTWSHFNSSR